MLFTCACVAYGWQSQLLCSKIINVQKQFSCQESARLRSIRVDKYNVAGSTGRATDGADLVWSTLHLQRCLLENSRSDRIKETFNDFENIVNLRKLWISFLHLISMRQTEMHGQLLHAIFPPVIYALHL
jgi:hypothetical protein